MNDTQVFLESVAKSMRIPKEYILEKEFKRIERLRKLAIIDGENIEY